MLTQQHRKLLEAENSDVPLSFVSAGQPGTDLGLSQGEVPKDPNQNAKCLGTEKRAWKPKLAFRE